MTNELIPQDATSGALTQHSFNDVASGGGGFLGRLQLFGSKSTACAEGKIPIGHWGEVNDDAITDLGEQVDVIIASWRPKAMETGDDLVISHDPESDLYDSIKKRSFIKDSGCMFGPELLVWLPDQNKFLTYFASSKTARREAKKAEPLLGRAATFKCHLIKTPKYAWHGPLFVPCTTPLDVPDGELIKEEVEKFQNPPKSEVEIVPEGEAAGRET